MTDFKSVVKTLLKAGIIAAYLGLIVILILQALTPGKESSQISNSVGDKINDIAGEINAPEVEIIKPESVKISSVTVSGKKYKEDITLSIGESGTVNGKVYPQNATNKSLTYSSSDNSIVEAYSSGKIVARSEGSATIRIESAEDENIFDEISVTVISVAVEKIEIDNIPDEIHVGEKHKVEVNFTPKNATNKSVSWQSSDTTVLTVSNSGSITAKKEGTATITVTSVANPELVASVEITVLPKDENPVIPAESLKINANDTTGYIGSSVKLTAKLYPDDASGKIEWYSSDESIATVSQKGVVSCLKAGEVTITAKCGDNIESSINITVKEVLSRTISLDFDNLSPCEGGYEIKQGESGKVVAKLDENATILDITYSSSDESIAKIGSDGTIEAIRGGTVTITVSTSYENETTSESFELTVDPITLKDTMENFYYTIRKSIGHFGAFLVLGILGSLTYYIIFPKSFGGKLLGSAVSLTAGFAVAGITEILQLPYFTEGRYCSFNDVLIDFSGYCTAAIPIALIILIFHLIKKLVKRA